MNNDATSESSVRSRPHFVIIGAGFAGISAAKALRGAEVDITIIDRNDFHTFQPLLYQVTTGTLEADQLSESLTTIFANQSNVTVCVDEVSDGSLEDKTIQLTSGRSLSFDYLLVAAGTKANFFGIEGMEEHSWPLYTMEDALKLRANLEDELQSVSGDSAGSSQATIVVVGGGPTGVEMAGALVAMDPSAGEKPKLRVVLVEALPRLLPMFSEESSEATLKDLRNRGVEVMLDTKVQSADADAVTFADGGRIESKTIVWGAGVRANPLGAKFGLETGRGGAIVVDEHLQIKDRTDVFAAGDNSTIDPAPKEAVPPVCPAAIQMGRHVGNQIGALIAGRPLQPFKYFNKGSMAVIGKGNAVVELKTPKLRFSGPLAWLMWLVIHNLYLDTMRNRKEVLGAWISAYCKGRKPKPTKEESVA